MESPKYETVLSDVKGNFKEKANQIEMEIFELERKEELLVIAYHYKALYRSYEPALSLYDCYSINSVTEEEVLNYESELEAIKSEIENKRQKMDALRLIYRQLE